MDSFFRINIPAFFLVLVMTIWPLADSKAGRRHAETYYQERWCAEQGGVLEFVVESGARCDCLTTTHAVEFDFADKWAEAIGQSLHYAALTMRRAGIVLIIEDPKKDARQLKRLTTTIQRHRLPIDIWTLKP